MNRLHEPNPYFEPGKNLDTVVLMGHMERDSVCERVEQWGRDLTDWSSDLDVITLPTVAGGIEANTELLMRNQHRFGKRTIQANITGDGGGNTLINANRQAAIRYPHIAETMQLFGDGGTMGDTARSFNGRRRLKRPSRILENGWLCTMNLTELVIQSGGEEEKIYVQSYTGAGFDAEVSKCVNGDGYRNSPWLRTPPTKKLRQVATVLEARKKAEPITIAENGGAPQTLSSVIYVAGPRMAGLYTGIKQLTEPGYHRVEVRDKNWAHLTWQIGRLMTRTIAKGEPSIGETYIEFKSDATVEYDGETRSIKAGDTATVRPGPQIHVVTTRKI